LTYDYQIIVDANERLICTKICQED